MSSRRPVLLVLSAAVAAVPVLTTAPAGWAVVPVPASAQAVAAPTPKPSPTATNPTPAKPAPVRPTPRPTMPAPRPTKPAPTPAKPANPVLRQGSSGVAVLTLQKRLVAHGYWLGKPTGRFGHSTAQAVMALQKAAGLGRDSVVGPATWKALNAGVRPKPRSTRGRVVEIDLKRQLLLFVIDGKTRFVVNTSTGARVTPTPRGRFSVVRQYPNGWRVAPLGRLYRPKFFYNGYAIHGVADGAIPGYPASHGCARVSTAVMDMLWASGPRLGDRVWVY